MVAQEQVIEHQIEYLLSGVAHNSEVTTLLKDLHELTSDQRQALAARLQEVAPDIPVPEKLPMISPFEGLYDSARYPASAALVTLYTLFEQVVIGYSILMVLARRAADSSVRGTDNTDDIVQKHMRDSAAAVQKIARLLPGVLVAELEEEGQECQCSCPSCGLGICLCAVSTRRMLEMAWTDAGPIYVPEGILMVTPRSRSAAAQSGLLKDDIVLTVDDKAIESIPMLQETIRNHKSGEEIIFQAQRKLGEQVEISVMRP
jgi:hypothetical protein